MANGIPMQAWGLWTGLGRSAFLADIGPGDRDPRRLLATIALGLAVAIGAGMAGWIVVAAPAAILSGMGGEGLKALGDLAIAIRDPHVQTLPLAVLRLMVADSTDAMFLMVFVAVAAALAGRALLRYVTAAPRFRWRLLLAGVVLAVIALIPPVVADSVAAGNAAAPPILAISPDLGARLIYALASLLLIPAALAEELVFRGWLLRQFAAVTRRPSALIIGTGLVFSAMHQDFAPDAFITRTVMGMGFAYMTLRLGGIELAAGVHAANNIMIILFIEQLGPATVSRGGGLAVETLISDLMMLAGYVAITEAVARIGPVSRMLGVRTQDLSPESAVAAPLS